MNAPDRFELFLLGDDEKKIEEKVYSGMSNTSDFILKKEDHTLGNLLSEHLKAHPHVYMAGYKNIFVEVCGKLINQLEELKRRFLTEWELRRVVDQGEQGNMM
ncbi:DNA-directed RNA polymerase II subunit RPB11 [Emericellopsis cladophorae]|uniref:DNA-directed RNA polymerase II subunit RPB11 n=1 Tax=Emericellopsis cladophorae TaxID=2686198 RepID=A0A9P9Y337_9HYPO|nr:DNA-directed RNA polymerase II subunit RPB11 [Emericellopsis cladophorae]KAI6782476.1 DNA-directed RNA polymerase II subunit RPB11 [Emericellopsis cladophorae]